MVGKINLRRFGSDGKVIRDLAKILGVEIVVVAKRKTTYSIIVYDRSSNMYGEITVHKIVDSYVAIVKFQTHDGSVMERFYVNFYGKQWYSDVDLEVAVGDQ